MELGQALQSLGVNLFLRSEISLLNEGVVVLKPCIYIAKHKVMLTLLDNCLPKDPVRSRGAIKFVCHFMPFLN